MEETHHDHPQSAVSKARLEFLFDGIFAIAMTILVLELKVPELNEPKSVHELGHALLHHAPTFGSYLLSFIMLGVFWYRHNNQYRHYILITRPMLILHLIQLAAAAFFPFCAALFGRYPTNPLSMVIYTGCVFVYGWTTFANWLVAKKHGAFAATYPEDDYLKTRRRTLRGCLAISAMFCTYLLQALQ